MSFYEAFQLFQYDFQIRQRIYKPYQFPYPIRLPTLTAIRISFAYSFPIFICYIYHFSIFPTELYRLIPNISEIKCFFFSKTEKVNLMRVIVPTIPLQGIPNPIKRVLFSLCLLRTPRSMFQDLCRAGWVWNERSHRRAISGFCGQRLPRYFWQRHTLSREF